MNKKTLKALKASITKWENNTKALTISDITTGPNDCPLCKMFFYRNNHCEGCPVKEKTGKNLCMDTPYDKIDRSFQRESFEQTKIYVQEEVDFLKSLLPLE